MRVNNLRTVIAASPNPPNLLMGTTHIRNSICTMCILLTISLFNGWPTRNMNQSLINDCHLIL